MKDKFVLDQEVDGIHFALFVCLKEIPKFLYIPENWIKQKLPDEDLPKDLNGKWIITYQTINFGSYWCEQEQEFNAMMRLIDYEYRDKNFKILIDPWKKHSKLLKN